MACTKAASAADAPNATAMRRQRQQRPHGGDLAVMGVPEFRKQQRAGGDAQENAGKRQRPRPAHLRAVERRRGVGGGRAAGAAAQSDEDLCGRVMRSFRRAARIGRIRNGCRQAWPDSRDAARGAKGSAPIPRTPSTPMRITGIHRHRRSDLVRNRQRLYRLLADDGERGRDPHRRGARRQAGGRLRLQFERPLCAARAVARALHSAPARRQAGRDRRRARPDRSGEMLGRR